MAGPWFVDLENGNDANTGASFAQRLLTIAAATSGKGVVAGDTVRVMGSTDPTLVDGTGAVWTQNSKTVTLSASVTQMISDCETAWTASANVTATTTTSVFKEGTKGANLAIASAFTTGLAAFFPTGTLNLSGFQQVSFWIQNSIAVAASVLSLRLCSDNAGVTTVNTIVIPALPSNSRLTAVTVDTGGALGASIQSIALYCDVDPGTITVNLDDIIACKASSSADALTLTSMIGKKWNLSWVASTTYAQNDKVRPTQPNRNGFIFKKQNAGSQSSGGIEPTWSTEIGVTVADGSITWVCDQLEDTWFPIQSINGTTVKIDNWVGILGNAGQGYAGDTETVPTYKREPINFTMVASSGTVEQSTATVGTQGNVVTYSGGWNRTDMSTQTGETWMAMQNGRSILLDGSKNFTTLQNFGFMRAATCLQINGASMVTVKNCHALAASTTPIIINSPDTTLIGVNASNGDSVLGLIDLTGTTNANTTLQRVTADSNSYVNGDGIRGGFTLSGRYVRARNNQNYGWRAQGVGSGNWNPPGAFSNFTTGNNGLGAINIISTSGAHFFNSLFPETTPFALLDTTNFQNIYVYSQKHQQTANNHFIQSDNCSCASATDQRHTPSGISWKFTTDATTVRGVSYPFELIMDAKRVVQIGVAFNVAIWTRRDSANITGALCIRGGQVAGVPEDVLVNCTPTVNTWVQSGTLTITPTEVGVVAISFLVWNTDSNSHNFWIDDISFP